VASIISTDKDELAVIESRLAELETEKQRLLERQQKLRRQQYAPGPVSQLSPEQ
jgi:hypothetical protein